MFTYLSPKFDSRKSFYKKAIITTEEDGTRILTSYKTKVAQINVEKKEAKIFGFHSQTTTRHIKEFFLQNGFNVYTKKDLKCFLVE